MILAQLNATPRMHRTRDREILSGWVMGKVRSDVGFLWLRPLAVHRNPASFIPWLIARLYAQLPLLLHVAKRLIFLSDI